MAYDEAMAELLRLDLAQVAGITERRMFGGLMFFRDGHMLIGVSGRGGGLARVGPAQIDAALALDGVSRMTMGGRTMKGFVRLDDAAMDDEGLRDRLLAMALDFVAGLPPKG
jgi:TfoX N-terminal domain.